MTELVYSEFCSFCGAPKHDDMFLCKTQGIRICFSCFKETGGCDTCNCGSCKQGAKK
ncbi:MAG: hypothetical protein LBC75_01065 [Fibromonadaceae bacterium]|nr:hypothetical protein [Fibromonadaceae bacterium]